MQLAKSFMISVLALFVIWRNQPLTARNHFFMAECLMKGLATRIHWVDVASHFPLNGFVRNYTDKSLKGTLPISMNNVSIAFMQSYPFVSVERMAHAGGLTACSLLDHPKLQEILRDTPTNPPYDLVIVEVLDYMYLSLEMVSQIHRVRVERFFRLLLRNEFLGTSRQHCGTVLTLFVSSELLHGIPERICEKTRRSCNFGRSPTVRGSLALLLVNSHHSMHRIRALAPAVVEVAGLHLNDDAGKLDSELENLLNRSESGCIYSRTGTIGEIESFPCEKLDALYEAFRRIAPVRVLVKIANGKELPPALPENVKIHPWYAQLRVLQHKNVKAFMTSSEFSKQSTALFHLLAYIPLFGDQQANVDTFARTKVLYQLSSSDITADNVERAIRTVLEDPSYSEGIKKLRTRFLDRPMKPLDTAIFWIEYVARRVNASARSRHRLVAKRTAGRIRFSSNVTYSRTLHVFRPDRPKANAVLSSPFGSRSTTRQSRVGNKYERQKNQENKLDQARNDRTLLPKPRNGNCEQTIRR